MVFTEIEKAALSKAAKLQDEKYLKIYRFMSVAEFITGMRDRRFNGEANWGQIPLSNFQGKSAKEWFKMIISKIDPEGSDDDLYKQIVAHNAENYKLLEEAYISILKKYRSIPNPHIPALREFRSWLLSYLSFALTRNRMENITFSDIPARDEKEACRIILNALTTHMKEDPRSSKLHSIFDKNEEIIRGLCEDGDYLIKHAQDVREILRKISSSSKYYGITSYTCKEKGRYEVLVFFNSDKFERTSESPSWGWLHNAEPVNVLGCIAIIPSRQFCVTLRNEILNAAERIAVDSVPIFDSKGRLFWPK